MDIEPLPSSANHFGYQHRIPADPIRKQHSPIGPYGPSSTQLAIHAAVLPRRCPPMLLDLEGRRDQTPWADTTSTRTYYRDGCRLRCLVVPLDR